MHLFLQLILNGIVVGAVYSLVSLGYALSFALNVNNFAQGSMVMLGGYFSFIFLQHAHIPLPLVFLLTAACGGIVAALVYFLSVRPFIRATMGLPVVAGTLAAGIIMDNIVFMLHGSDFFSIRKFVHTPVVYRVAGIVITDVQLLLAICSFLLLAILFFIVAKTDAGLRLRALADDYQASLSLGYSVRKTILFAMVISGMLGTVAGYLISFDYDLDANSGIGFLTKAYTATVIGGTYHLKRVAFAAYGIAIVENLVAGYLSSEYMLASVFFLLILFLIFRKEGLGKSGLRREI
jgi:branched-chain amino acid transport system permease protein